MCPQMNIMFLQCHTWYRIKTRDIYRPACLRKIEGLTFANGLRLTRNRSDNSCSIYMTSALTHTLTFRIGYPHIIPERGNYRQTPASDIPFHCVIRPMRISPVVSHICPHNAISTLSVSIQTIHVKPAELTYVLGTDVSNGRVTVKRDGEDDGKKGV